MAFHNLRIALAAVPMLAVAASMPVPTLAQNASLPTSGEFWTCDPGFTLQTSNNAVRCIKPAGRVQTNPGNCAFPSVKRIDHRGQVDACVAGVIAGDMVCLDPTTRIEIRRGADVCVKNVGPVTRQPANKIRRG